MWRHDAKTELISHLPLFAGCTPAEVKEIAAIADEIDLATGRRLTVEGARGQEFVVIAEGAAEVRRNDAVVATLGAGGFVGEVSLLTGEPRNATVVATEPVRALVIEEHRFHALLERVPSIRTKVEAAAASRHE